MPASRIGQILATVVTRFFGKSANFIVLAILARALSTSDLGVYGFIFISSIIASVALDVGVRNSSAFFIGRQPARSRSLTKCSLLLFLPLGALSVIIGPQVLLLQNSGVPMHAVVAPTALNILALLFTRMEQGILLGNGRISVFNRTELVPRALLLAGTIFTVIFGDMDLTTAMYVLACSNACGALAVAVAVIPMARGGTLNFWSDTRILIGRGFVFMLGVVAMLAAQKVTFLVVSGIGDTGEDGLFYGLLRLTEFMTEVGLAVSVVIFSNSVRSESKDKAVHDVAESTRVCFALFILLTIFAYWFAPVILPLALGDDFAGYESLFRILLIGTLVGTIWTMTFPTLTTVDHPVIALAIMVPNLVAGTALTWALYEAAGLTGAAWASVISQVGLTGSMLLAFKIRHRASLRSFIVISFSDLRNARVFGRRVRSANEVHR